VGAEYYGSDPIFTHVVGAEYYGSDPIFTHVVGAEYYGFDPIFTHVLRAEYSAPTLSRTADTGRRLLVERPKVQLEVALEKVRRHGLRQW
jgi:hypothetical protein